MAGPGVGSARFGESISCEAATEGRNWGPDNIMNTGKTANVETPTADVEKPETRDAAGRPMTQRRSEVRLGREVQARIGQQLRAMYDEVVKEGVPSHITALVRKLSAQDDGAA